MTYDNLIDAVGSVLSRNEKVGAIVYHPRNELALAKAKEATTNAYLKPPAYLDGIPRLQSAQLPTNEVEGTSGAVCNSMIVGDFSQLYIGIRTNFGIDVHTSPAATTGQVLMVAWMRMDVQVGRPGAFALRTGLEA